MKIASFMLSALAVANELEYDQLVGNKDEKKKYPINKLARLNKIMNQYTVWAKGLRIEENLDLEQKNVGKALSRNNRWYQGLSRTFYRTDKNGAPAKCSSYFNPEDEDRKRRSTGGLDIMRDPESERTKCQIAFDEADEMGLTLLECLDCCKKDADDNWILPGTDTRTKQFTMPDDLAKALRRVIGATKRWERRFIDECGGAENRPNRYYNILLKRLKNGLKSDVISEEQITTLKWKRVFKDNKMKHSNFFSDLGISVPE